MKKIFSLFAAVLFAGSMMAANFRLVTDASTLKAGDEVIIISPDSTYALGTTQNSNNRKAEAITASEECVIVPGANIQIVTLEASGDNWKFKVGDDQYLYAASKSSNHLKTASAATAGDNGVWSIAIDAEGVATIVAQGANTRNHLRYNGSNKIFACYAESSTVKTKAKICKKEASTTPLIDAFDINFKEVAVEAETTFEKDFELEVLGENLTEAIVAEAGLGLSVSGTLTAEGGKLTVHVSAAVGDFASTITLKSGETTKIVNVTGKVVEIEGKGTAESPYSCATARVLALSGAEDEVYVKGYVTEIETPWSSEYSNISFWVADAKDGGKVFEAYRAVCADESDAPVVGDLVLLHGTLKEYSGTPELAQSCTFEIIEDTPSALDNTSVEIKTVKVIENGQLVIIRDGVRYNALGAQL